jgi:hypothetical protein
VFEYYKEFYQTEEKVERI